MLHVLHHPFPTRLSSVLLACSWAFVGARTVPAPLLLAGEGGAKRRVRVRHFAAAGADARCSYPCAVTSTTFPIDALLPQVRESLMAHTRLVPEAPPGAGKPTQAPPTLLDAPWTAGKKNVLPERRRVASRPRSGCRANQQGGRGGR